MFGEETHARDGCGSLMFANSEIHNSQIHVVEYHTFHKFYDKILKGNSLK